MSGLYSGVLCDCRINVKLKGKVYITVVRPVINAVRFREEAIGEEMICCRNKDDQMNVWPDENG